MPASDPVEALLPQIRAAVAEAVAGVATLEFTIGRLLLNRDPRFDDPPWTPLQRAVWSKAVHLWLDARRQPEAEKRQSGFLQRAAPIVALEDVWGAVERIAERNGRAWWNIQRGWPVLSRELGISDRRAAYWMAEVQGWKFDGPSGSRRISDAPCVRCGKPTPADLIRLRCCPTC